MIEKIEQIETTEASHPFASAYKKCNLAEKGYVEEEFFIHGKANVYGWVDGKKGVLFPDNPYVNRILVRRPEDREAFSGNVVVEILNSTSFIDVDRCWVLTYRHLMRNGDIYIGITSKPNVVPAMQKVDAERYATLNWKNPQKDPQYTLKDQDLGNMEGASSPETEDGLFWDMLTDLADILREKENPLIGEYFPYYQYLAGWSQSAAYMIRFINDFAYENERDIPYFDGYFSTGGASVCMPDLNQGYGRTAASSDRRLRRVCQPYIEMHTESENALWGNQESRGTPSFEKEMQYCIYDIPGSTHDSKANMVDYYIEDRDIFLSGIVLTYPGKERYPNDYPYEVAFQAALSMLYAWVREGKKPLQTEPIKVDENLVNITDETGNAIGGFRLPFVEVPICEYHPFCTPIKPDFAFGSTLFGYVKPYSKERAMELYGSKETYLQKFKDSLKDCICRGLVLPEDEEFCMEYAQQKAAEVFDEQKPQPAGRRVIWSSPVSNK